MAVYRWKGGNGKWNDVDLAVESAEELKRDARFQMIQMLIPIGLEAVCDELQSEVIALAGERHERGGAMKRWGTNPGSVFLGDQKVSVNVPRVRNVVSNREVPLAGYKRLQSPGVIDQVVLSRVINGISHRKYAHAALEAAETFGIGKSSISKKFIRASSKKLREFAERDLSGHDIVAIFIDGKSFADREMVVALGVTMAGDKVILGFTETDTENFQVCRDFLNGLLARGLSMKHELLFIIDGSKGIYKAVTRVMKEKAFIQRCQWHKRENVVAYLPKTQQGAFKRKLQAAYEEPSYEAAKKKMEVIKKELKLINQSALASLEEGFEETLTIHRLGMFEKLGTSFKPTNCIENVNSRLSAYTGRVTCWRNSDQRHRWVGTALLEVEPTLRKVRGHNHLAELRTAMKRTAKTETEMAKAA